MKIKRLKKIEVNSNIFNIVWDSKSYGGSFSYEDNRITIGCKDKSPIYLFSIILHELLEICSLEMGIRYTKPATTCDYIFNLDHTQFTTLTNMAAGLTSKFIE